MKNKIRHTGTLEILGRMPSSSNGNPRYRLAVDGWSCVTSVDSQEGYAVPSMNGKKVNAVIGTHYGVATLDSISLIKE